MAAVLDTHTVIWYCLSPRKLFDAALRFVRQSIEQRKPVYVSAISLIETVYLLELGRIPFETWNLLDAALKDTASGLSLTPVDAAIAEAVYRIPRNAVPDMPDRIIGATALHMKSRLVTRDARLRAAGIDTVW